MLLVGLRFYQYNCPLTLIWENLDIVFVFWGGEKATAATQVGVAAVDLGCPGVGPGVDYFTRSLAVLVPTFTA